MIFKIKTVNMSKTNILGRLHMKSSRASSVNLPQDAEVFEISRNSETSPDKRKLKLKGSS